MGLTDDEKLKDVLMNSIPILFVGAGFSYGSTNSEGELPTGDGLRKDIYDNFICGKYFGRDASEISKYNLQDLCQAVCIVFGFFRRLNIIMFF